MAEKVKLIFDAEGKKALKTLKDINKQLGKTEKATKKTSKSMKGFSIASIGWAAAIAGIGMAMKKAIGDASDLEEATTKFEVVFRGVEIAANSMKDELVAAFGMSRLEATEALSGFQDFLVPMGLARAEAAKLSGAFTTLAVDIGSFNNQPTAIVVEDIKSAMAGMSRPLRKYGIDVSETTLKNMALARGITIVNGKLDNQTRAMLIHEKISLDSADAMGDFQRTQEGLANTMKITGARIADMSAAFGELLLPIAQKVVKWVGKITKTIGDMVNSFMKVRKEMAGSKEALKKYGIETSKEVKAVENLAEVYKKWKWELDSVRSAQETINAVRKRGEDPSRFVLNYLATAKESTAALGQEMQIYKEILEDTQITTGLQALEVMNGRIEAIKKEDLALQAKAIADKARADKAKKLRVLTKKETLKIEKAHTKELGKLDRERAQGFATWQSFMANAQSSKIGAIAKLAKAAAIAETIQSTHAAAMGAYKALSAIPFVGPVLGAVAAAAAIVYGAERVAAIASTPTPHAEHGAFIPGSPGGTNIIAGEKGKAEAIIPLEDSPISGLGTTIIIQGDVYGMDDFQEKVDEAMFRAKQDNSSRFAEELS